MAYFCSLDSHLQVLSKEDLKGTRIEHGFKRALMSLFGQDDDTFTSTMLLNEDQLQKQLDKDEFQDDGSMAAVWVINRQFQQFIDSKFTLDYDSQMTDKYFAEYTGIEVKQFRETLLQHMSNVKKSVAERTLGQNQKWMTTTGQQHIEQPKIINECRVDRYPEQCQVKSPMLDSSPDNQTTEYSKQYLESENILLKKTVAQFQKDLGMEAHCITLELKYQNHALKSRQHGQILNETSNKAIMKKEIDAFETIELKHKQTTSLLANNADLKAQIQEKVFAIAALKNELRKLKGNSVDTKPKISKPRFASQVNVEKDLSKPVTQHYLPKGKESAFAKPNYMIASSSSRNSSKNMPRFSSNDMVHNHYLDEVRKKTQKRDRNSKTSVMPSARFQSTADGSKPKPRSTNHSTRSLSIFTEHRFSPNKTSAVYDKTSPRSNLRWKSTGRIFKTVGFRWVPTGKILASCTRKDDSEPTHGSNVYIPNIHECKQTLDLSVGKSQSMVAEKADISKTSVTVDSQMMKLQ
ncbi:hypothetical protein Tco_0228346 [Tanacetum coccineum]